MPYATNFGNGTGDFFVGGPRKNTYVLYELN